MKYKLEITYDGTNYAGWQNQPEKLSVQQVIEEKLSYLYANRKISVRGAGRTDAGVHAVNMTASFAPLDTPAFSNKKLHKAMNSILPPSIYIKNIKPVDADFDARFSAIGKAYTYVISRQPPGPFLHNWCWQINSSLNIGKIKKAAEYLIGEHDFSAFTVKLGKTDKNPVRKIYKIEINDFNNFLCITFTGKSFLYKMVRSLAGTLIKVGEEKIEPIDVKHILESGDRSKAHITAPAKGLFLMQVFYDRKTMDNFTLTALPFYPQADK